MAIRLQWQREREREREEEEEEEEEEGEIWGGQQCEVKRKTGCMRAS